MKILTRDEMVAEYDSAICDLCKKNGYLDNLAPCSTCEGSYPINRYEHSFKNGYINWIDYDKERGVWFSFSKDDDARIKTIF